MVKVKTYSEGKKNEMARAHTAHRQWQITKTSCIQESKFYKAKDRTEKEMDWQYTKRPDLKTKDGYKNVSSGMWNPTNLT